jgi:hypothetical protein
LGVGLELFDEKDQKHKSRGIVSLIMAKGMASTDPINDGLGVRWDGDECVGMVGLPEHLQHRARLNQSITHTVSKSIN